MSDDWLARVASLNQATLRDGKRAPHKPLLILAAVANWQRTGTSRLAFRDFEPTFARVLEEFAPPAKKVRPEYPFVYLENDGVWQTEHIALPDHGVPRAAQLRDSGATGHLVPELENALAADPALVAALVNYLLASNFPESLHADVCASLGLDLESLELRAGAAGPMAATSGSPITRDPRFRVSVLEAYEQRCAMCGFGGMLEGRAVGVEAAHVRWHSIGGPDQVSNGVALCILHHKMFDRGVLGITEGHRVVVSAKFAPRSDADDQYVVSLNDQELLGPQSSTQRPDPSHVRWHLEQVFRSPVRPVA